jgi:hypothetical protein
MEVGVKEITIVKASGETSIEITLKKAASRVVDLIIDVIYYHRFYDKRSTIYAGNLDTS